MRNYGYGDYHLVLDYIRRKGEPDRTPEQMRQDIDVFLRECRKEYRKAGLEFKYIHVMEIGKKGARHHHLVVNKIDTEILQRCWYKAYEGHNRVKVFPLDDSGNYAELASYLIKYTGTHKKGTDGALQGKRWNCSKNLARPEPEYHIISDREYFKKEPKDDLFGEDNSTLAPTMQLIHTQNEGIINAVKNSANIRFLAKVANMLKPEDIKKERKRFTEDNLSADNDSGMIIYDNKFSELKQVESKPYTPNALQI